MTRLAPGCWLAVTLFVACAAPTDDPTGPGRALSAKGGGGGGVTVSAADPSYGTQGEAGKAVRIIGSGFQPGDQASWQRNGVVDPKIQVLSTQYVSSTELVATINIAADAELAFYDIAIYAPGRKGGIGTELFEVTQATAITGTTRAMAATEDGQIVGDGGGAWFWSSLSGLEVLNANAAATDISEDGLTVVGGLGTGLPTDKTAAVWTRSGSSWLQTILAKDPAAAASNARAVASHPLTGEAAIIAGVDIYKVKKGNTMRREPRLWLRSAGGWTRIALPLPAVAQLDVLAMDVTADGVVVGNGGQHAVAWEPDGLGGWTALVVGPHLSDLGGINRAGTLAVGRSEQRAAYWQRAGGTWTGPFILPVICGRATDVDDLGRILVSECELGPNGEHDAGVILPPYGPADVIPLGGLGNRTAGASTEGMSKQGTWIVGRATFRNNSLSGAYWRVF